MEGLDALASRHAKKVGLPPGTPLYTGQPREAPVRIQVFDYDAEHLTEREMTVEECTPYFHQKNSVTWINVDGVHDEKIVQDLCERFHVHPLAMEDVLSIGSRPKCDEYESIFFIVAYMIEAREDEEKHPWVYSEQVSIAIGHGFVLTFQESPGDVWDPVRKRLRTAGSRTRRNGADYLAYALLDAIVDHYFVALERLGEEVEALEDSALEAMPSAMLGRIHDLKRQLLTVRKSVWPLREVMGTLLRADPGLITRETQTYLRDLHDHVIQAIETTELYRESAVGLVELYLASASNRMNEVMKVLTIIATIFIPVTFVSSVYGMNFDVMPELHWKFGYPFALGLMAAIAIAMIAYFRRNHWM